MPRRNTLEDIVDENCAEYEIPGINRHFLLAFLRGGGRKTICCLYLFIERLEAGGKSVLTSVQVDFVGYHHE
jgi:hypothetical protein